MLSDEQDGSDAWWNMMLACNKPQGKQASKILWQGRHRKRRLRARECQYRQRKFVDEYPLTPRADRDLS